MSPTPLHLSPQAWAAHSCISKPAHRSDVGVAGLIPAGQALALRLAARGLRVSVWDALPQRVQAFVSGHADARGGMVGYSDCEDFIESLDQPRRVVVFESEAGAIPILLRARSSEPDRWLEYLSNGGDEFPCGDLDHLELTLVFQMA